MNGNGTRGRGQALVEFALVLPLLLLLILNLVNFGMIIRAMITVANAARTGVQYMVLAGASVGGPQPPSVAAVRKVVTDDASALDRTKLTILVCTNNNGTLSGGCLNMPGDPEPTHYVLAVVDVAYTYVPLVGALSFSNTPIHRRAVMRMLQ